MTYLAKTWTGDGGGELACWQLDDDQVGYQGRQSSPSHPGELHPPTSPETARTAPANSLDLPIGRRGTTSGEGIVTTGRCWGEGGGAGPHAPDLGTISKLLAAAAPSDHSVPTQLTHPPTMYLHLLG